MSSQLSILYLRCSSNATAETLILALLLSILYLRCRHDAPPLPPVCKMRPFNSLFEMHFAEDRQAGAAVWAFNSLFEMLNSVSYSLNRKYDTFNSLFEMLKQVSKREFEKLPPFQFSIWDAGGHGADDPVYLLHRPFNSLFEMQHRDASAVGEETGFQFSIWDAELLTCRPH